MNGGISNNGKYSRNKVSLMPTLNLGKHNILYIEENRFIISLKLNVEVVAVFGF